MMSNFAIHWTTGGTLLLLAATLGAEAQEPHTQSQTSVVQQLNVDSSATRTVTGRTRELRCRGKPGIDMRIHQDSSPRRPKLVTMVLRYERLKETRSFAPDGMVLVDYGRSLQWQPGGCTWTSAGVADIPPEPGVVYFDLPRDAQAWAAPGARDTTITAAVHWPDVVSLPRYLSDSSRYWVFYVDDVTNLSISFSAWPRGGGLSPTFGAVAGSLHDTSPASATLSSARMLPADTAVRAPTGVRQPTPTSSVAGPLRDQSPVTATPSGGRALPTDSTARRTAVVRTPTPTGTVAEGLRDSSPGNATPSSTRALPTDSATGRPVNASATSRQLQARRIWNVQTAPGPLGVRITFDVAIYGLFREPIFVTISSQRPSWDEGERQWSYPPWHGFMSADVRRLRTGRFEIQPTYELDAGRRYYYLIEVHGADATSPNVQRTGSFTAAIGP